MTTNPFNQRGAQPRTVNRQGSAIPRAAALSWLAAVAITCAQAQSIQLLPPLPGSDNALPYGVSADGTKVVGTSFLPSGDADRGFVWTLAGGSQPIVGAPVSFGTAISGDGSTVVGLGFDNDFNISGYSYRNGTMTPTGSLTGTGFGANANAVNFDGSVVVGQSDIPNDFNQRAFRWTSGGGIQDLGTLNGAIYSLALGISADGSVIVGNSGSESDGLAFRWTQADGMTALPRLLGSDFDGAYGISADGSTIVGFSNSQAVRWRNGLVEPLGLVAGLKYSRANASSADGEVIGGIAYGNGSKAFVWTPQTGIINLQERLISQGVNLNGWQLLEVSGVSADGSVLVGNGALNGQMAGFVVTGFSAVPEPTPVALALSALGLFGTVSWMRSRRSKTDQNPACIH